MVRRSRAVLFGTIACVLAAVLAFLGGWQAAASFAGGSPLTALVVALSAGDNAADTTPDTLRNQFRVFWEVWNLVDAGFYSETPVSQRQMVYGAIQGMLGSLGDEYTVFQEPDVAAGAQEWLSGQQEGIGAFIRVRGTIVEIERPIPDSPAAKAGIQDGDILLKVDDTVLASVIAGLDAGEAAARVAALIRGEKGTTVRLELQRPGGDVYGVAIVRDTVPLVSVHWDLLDGQIAYLQITEFKATTTEELDRALRELLPQQPRGVVLDLRNNPGGLLDTSLEVLGRFYRGVALYERTRTEEAREFRTRDGPADVQVFDLPVVVLVNGGSASASEIVAGALRDERAGTWLLGERTFGKGSVQNVYPLQDGSNARITVAHWFTPDRQAIQKVGITPQYVVPFAQEPIYSVPCAGLAIPPSGQTSCSDAQLSWALRLLTTGEQPPALTPNPAPGG